MLDFLSVVSTILSTNGGKIVECVASEGPVVAEDTPCVTGGH